MTPMEAGTVLAGKYRLDALIGQGGMGSVWRAEHLGLHAPVAVKLLNIDVLGDSAAMLARFHREAHAAAAIRSPHVVQIFDHGVDEVHGTPFIVMELMEGQSLAERMARVGRLQPSDVARIFTQVARALSRAHDAGIVHRDLKPDNVFLVRNEDEEVAKVLDFGIAKASGHALRSDASTQTGAMLGTAYYMSPEQIRGTKQVDFRTDLWAFGVMACECLTGTRPFDAETFGDLTLKICVEPMPRPSSLGPVPAGFDAWFERILSRDPAQRFVSAREAAETLRQVCSGEARASQPALAAAPVEPSPSDGVVPAASAATGAPTSRPASDHGEAIPARPKRSALLTLVAVTAVAAGGMLWLQRAKVRSAELESPSASPAAPLAAAAPSASLLAPAVADPVVAPDSALPAPPPVSAPLAVSAASAPRAPASAASRAAHATPSVAAVAPKSVAPPRKTAIPRDVIDDRR